MPDHLNVQLYERWYGEGMVPNLDIRSRVFCSRCLVFTSNVCQSISGSSIFIPSLNIFIQLQRYLEQLHQNRSITIQTPRVTQP
jgi:hypothetical protein